MSKEVTSLYICPWSLRDSLCQSQSLAYLKELAAAYKYKFALMTFENPIYKTDAQIEKKIKTDLAKNGIFWYPVKYRAGASVKDKLLESAGAIAENWSGNLTEICTRCSPARIFARTITGSF